MVLLSLSDAQEIHIIPDLLRHLNVQDELWDAFLAAAGDPGNDVRLLAAMPYWTIPQIVGTALLPNGSRLTPIQAAQVGLVWRNARWVIHVRGGGNPEAFVDRDPWVPETGPGPPDGTGTGGGTGGTPTGTGGGSSGGKDNVLKMSNIVDQTDDSETKLPDAVLLNEWAQRYIATMGAPPQEEEEPTDAQLAALHHRVRVQRQPPYVDFSVWLPFGRRVLKNQKFRAFLPIGDGSFVMKELPGPQNLQQWLVSWRVFKVACISLNLVTLAALLLYEKVIEKLVLQWPKAWGLIAQADDKARAEKLEKTRRAIVLDIAAGGTAPREFTEDEPWTACFRALALDERFWNEQVRHPAAAWLASGGHGSPKPPAETIAMAHIPGPPAERGDDEDRGDRRRQANRDKRMAKRKRWASDREELANFREQRSKGDSNKGKGKGKGKDQAGQEFCYSWAKSVGPCAGLPPGSECKGKIKRVHKCMTCFSPSHPNAECPRKAASPS